ncbi:MAG: hypothetical protein HY703_13075 [Gemmatimonadetes bacterium]|nr:hypothetical protein [Gemmatimonadota bacterium]
MKCESALDQLLEAEPAELRGEGDSDLAAHVRACPRCRAVTERLLLEQDSLGQLLTSLRPARDAEQALARTLDAARAPQLARGLRTWAALPLAAAAALAALLLLRRQDAGQLAEPLLQAAAARREPPPMVAAPPGKGVIVFHTGNPDIAVIWFFDTEKSS